MKIIKKKRRSIFTKGDFRKTINLTVEYLCDMFGYTKKPKTYETTLDENVLMQFVHLNKKCAILYDYKKFIKHFGSLSYEVQKAKASCTMAHEVRHYYQHRQMYFKTKLEDADTIASWIENELNPIELTEGVSISEFCQQPLELDAYLFEYCFGAKMFELLLFFSIKDMAHFDAMEQLYVKYFGETDLDLFGDKIREKLKQYFNI